MGLAARLQACDACPADFAEASKANQSSTQVSSAAPDLSSCTVSLVGRWRQGKAQGKAQSRASPERQHCVVGGRARRHAQHHALRALLQPPRQPPRRLLPPPQRLLQRPQALRRARTHTDTRTTTPVDNDDRRDISAEGLCKACGRGANPGPPPGSTSPHRTCSRSCSARRPVLLAHRSAKSPTSPVTVASASTAWRRSDPSCSATCGPHTHSGPPPTPRILQALASAHTPPGPVMPCLSASGDRWSPDPRPDPG